jgi:hypothetical protein
MPFEFFSEIKDGEGNEPAPNELEEGTGQEVPEQDPSEGGLAADPVTAHPDYTGNPEKPSFDDPPS